jgi:hypothetical protein
MVMLAAAGVEGGLALCASVVRVHIFPDTEFRSADAAKNCLLIELSFRPNLRFMIRLFLVTGKTRVVLVAALEFDGDNVQLRAPMHTACLGIY